jgi:uncharacterized protein (DUF427 family)
MTPDASERWIHVEESPRRVRAMFGGETVADSKHALLLRETRTLPVYYFPTGDVRMERMQPSAHRVRCPDKGDASYWTIRVGGKVAENAAWSYPTPSPQASALAGHVAFQWNLMDAWYEEEEEIFVHPRDPYKRVDVLPSSRHVRVVVHGETIADTRRPHLLFETGLPTRYYLPMEDVRRDVLVPSDTSSRCPYKGIASYWSVRVGATTVPDLIWTYRDPIPECPKIRELLCFFQEREATLYVDGEPLPKPTTRWSR